MLHAYLGDGSSSCAFAFEGGFCGKGLGDGIHEVADGVTISSGEVPTERLDLPDPSNAMSPGELGTPRVRVRAREAEFGPVEHRGRSFAEKPLWRAAAEAMVSETETVPSGPWPVRKLRLADPDAPDTAEHDQQHYAELLRALYAIGQDYLVCVWRPLDAHFRFACVTWGWATTLTLEQIADEIALRYDRTAS